MAVILGRSDKALRGRVLDVYQTEDLDAVRQLIGEGTWGDGRTPKRAGGGEKRRENNLPGENIA